MPEKPIAHWYTLEHKTDLGRALFRRTDSRPVDLPAGRNYAIFEIEPGEVVELGVKHVIVRGWAEDDPLTVADFMAALARARDQAAAATQRLEDWYARACPQCRGMVVTHAANPESEPSHERAESRSPKRAKRAKRTAAKVSGSRPKKSGPIRRKVSRRHGKSAQ